MNDETPIEPTRSSMASPRNLFSRNLLIYSVMYNYALEIPIMNDGKR